MLYIILATLFYSVAIILATVATRNAPTALVTAVMNAVSVILPVALAVPVIVKQGVPVQKTGLWFAVLTGIMIALFTLTLNKSYAENKIAVVAPIVFGGSIFLSTILSFFVFKEKVGMLQTIGLSILALGLLIIIYARLTGR